MHADNPTKSRQSYTPGYIPIIRILINTFLTLFTVFLLSSQIEYLVAISGLSISMTQIFIFAGICAILWTVFRWIIGDYDF